MVINFLLRNLQLSIYIYLFVQNLKVLIYVLGRSRDPQYRRGEIPHSCGEPCRKRRKGLCKHPCAL